MVPGSSSSEGSGCGGRSSSSLPHSCLYTCFEGGDVRRVVRPGCLVMTRKSGNEFASLNCGGTICSLVASREGKGKWVQRPVHCLLCDAGDPLARNTGDTLM